MPTLSDFHKNHKPNWLLNSRNTVIDLHQNEQFGKHQAYIIKRPKCKSRSSNGNRYKQQIKTTLIGRKQIVTLMLYHQCYWAIIMHLGIMCLDCCSSLSSLSSNYPNLPPPFVFCSCCCQFNYLCPASSSPCSFSLSVWNPLPVNPLYFK